MRTKIQVQLLVFGIVVVVVGLVFVVLGLRSKSMSDDLQARGVSESAKITDATVEKGAKNKKRYILTVSWGAPEASQVRKFSVEKAYFLSKLNAENRLVSPDITVRQIPGDPDSALIEGQKYAFSGGQWAGYFVTLLGAVMAYKGYRKGPAPAAL
ncbi:MAG: DUF3592 domain-containing protein [Roseimicrobium sp.]